MDTYHLPPGLLSMADMGSANSDVRMFWPDQVTGATTAWQLWTKPRGRNMLGIVAISGGGGGGGPNAGGNGGKGGGSSGISRYVYPAWVIPDELYILVGHGGPGGANTVSGTAGQLSYVSVYANTAANNLFAVSGAAAPGGGGSAAGGVGTAGTIATDAGAVFSCWALTKYIAGVDGTTGSGAGSGTDLSVGTGCMILGGCGGGEGAGARGGGYSAVSNTPFIAETPANGVPGNAGFRFGQFPLIYGGSGGSGATSNGGGCGINAPGAGGGGGGDGVSPTSKGGNGGPGLVMMISW